MSTGIIDKYEVALRLIKAQLGISSEVRDEYLTAIVKGVSSELEEINGIHINMEDEVHLMYVVDLSCHRYENRDAKTLPENLKRRLYNLILNKKIVQ